MVGGARRSAPEALLVALALLLAGSIGIADEMYKYRGPDGEWIYADRPPDDDSLVEIRQLEGDSGSDGPEVKVTHGFEGRIVAL